MTGEPLILDCDPGVDDAVALFLALGSGVFDLKAVTTVAGNRALDVVTRNARALLTLCGRGDVPVHAGSPRGLLPREVRWSHAHGDDGLGGIALPGDPPPVAPGHAADVIVRHVMDAPEGTVSLAAVGPLTNVALAFAMAPEVPRRLKRLGVMGGAVGVPGNITPMAEFNVMHDPVAAEIVLSSGAPITLFGLDVTRSVRMTPAFLEALEGSASAAARAAAAMMAAYSRRDAALHDPCVIAHMLSPDLFATERACIGVDYRPGPTEGATFPVREAAGRPCLDVARSADVDAVLALIAEALVRLP